MQGSCWMILTDKWKTVIKREKVASMGNLWHQIVRPQKNDRWGNHEIVGKWWTNGIFNETTAINDKKVIRGEFLAGGEPPVELWSLEAKAGNLGAPVEAAPVSYSQTSHQRGRHCCQFFSPSFSRRWSVIPKPLVREGFDFLATFETGNHKSYFVIYLLFI